ncbi:PLAT domain-containing protein 3 [Bienertia sinuspersici]
MEIKLLIFSIIFIVAFLLFPAYAKDDVCTYIVYVQTRYAEDATTHANVKLVLRDTYFQDINITNLKSWGIMSKYHHYYFRRGNLDAFAFKGKCMKGPLCSMTLSHDNTCVAPSWYVDYVEVTAIAPNRGCRKIKFPVNAWVAVDKPPYGSARWGVYLCDEIVRDHGNCSSKI